MTGISSISEFLLQAGTQYRIYDMGRGIRKLNNQVFLELEAGQAPYPFPRQQLAWVGFVFWNKNLSSQHYIWFVKLPLDEQGCIVSAHRDQFLSIIIEALGQDLEHAENKQGQLPENPYTFVPTQQQLADFNGISRRDLKLPESEHYAGVVNYIQAPQVIDWQQLSLQGIADYACGLDQPDNQQALIQQWQKLPASVQQPLLNSMENQPLSAALVEFLCEWIPTQSVQLQAQGLRAMAQAQAIGLVKPLITRLLDKSNAASLDILVVISGRHWSLLKEPALLMLFMHQLAVLNQTQKVFQSLYADLVQIPELRTPILQLLRTEDKSRELEQAIGELFTEIKQ